MSKFFYVLDAGHGGIDPSTGKYVTAPAKMFKHEDGLTIYEGVFNRKVRDKLAALLSKEGIDFCFLTGGHEDVSLNKRVKEANKLYDLEEGRTILISIHGNAGGGTGFEVFTTRGETKSDKVAKFFIDEMAKEFPTKKKRVDLSDGDEDKEANFRVLMCKGMAVLTENFFFDNYQDAKLMATADGQGRVAKAHFEAIKRIEKEL